MGVSWLKTSLESWYWVVGTVTTDQAYQGGGFVDGIPSGRWLSGQEITQKHREGHDVWGEFVDGISSERWYRVVGTAFAMDQAYLGGGFVQGISFERW